MTTLAVIPVVFLWDDGSPLCARWDDTPERRARHVAHAAGHPDLPPHGRSPAIRYWMSERRERWFHDARTRG